MVTKEHEERIEQLQALRERADASLERVTTVAESRAERAERYTESEGDRKLRLFMERLLERLEERDGPIEDWLEDLPLYRRIMGEDSGQP